MAGSMTGHDSDAVPEAMIGARTAPPAPAVATFVVAVVAAWTFLGLLTASQYYIATRSIGGETNWLAMFWEVPVWLIWAPLTGIVILAVRRYPLDDPSRRWRELARHALFAAVLGVAYIAFWMTWTIHAVPWNEQVIQAEANSVLGHFWMFFRARFSIAYAFYWAIVGAYYAWINYQRMLARETEAIQARSELANARLNALRSQLRPHFLFNTLHTVAAVLEDDPVAAREVLAKLSDLLRRTLDQPNRDEIPLHEELESVRDYLAIEKTRFGDRLDYSIQVDGEAGDALVPPFVLQPIVENAVRHGVSPSAGGGRVLITATRSGGTLSLEVRDNGVGFARDGLNAASPGIGLTNTRQRLQQMYGNGAARLVIRDGPARGALVSIHLPYRRSSAAAVAPAG